MDVSPKLYGKPDYRLKIGKQIAPEYTSFIQRASDRSEYIEHVKTLLRKQHAMLEYLIDVDSKLDQSKSLDRSLKHIDLMRQDVDATH